MSNLSFVTHEGDGATVMFPIAVAGENIGYFRTSDIHVYVDEVEVSFTIDPNSPHLVVLSSAPADGSDVLIRRIMPKDSTYANFERGNNFGQRQVNNSFLQQLYTTQELLDGFWPEGYYWKQNVNAGGKLLKNLGDAVDPDDAVKKETTDLLDERISTVEEGIFSDSRYIHWLYNDGLAAGGELKIYPPFKFKTISTVYINGVRQTYGLAFDYDTADYSVEFAEELEEGDEVVVAIGTEPKEFVPESADLILTSSNSTVQHELDIKDGLTVAEAINFNGIDSLLGSRVWLIDRNSWFQVVLTATAGTVVNGMDLIQSVANNLYSFRLVDTQKADGYGVRSFTDPSQVRNAIQRFFNNIGTGGYGEMEEHDYVIDGAVALEEKVNAHVLFKGDVNIRSNNKAEEVLRLSGRILKTTGLPQIGYTNETSLLISDTDAVGVLFTGLARSFIDGFRIRHTGLGCKIDQATGFGYELNGQNALFSVTFGYVDIFDFSYAAFDFRAFNGGNTGNYMANFYMNNNVGGQKKVCNRYGWVGTTGEWTFGQLNFEWGSCRHLFTIQSDVSLINIASLHIEGINPTNPAEGFFYFNNNTTMNITSMTVKSTEVDGNTLVNYALFRLADDVNVNIEGLDEKSDFITNSPNLRIVRYAGVGTSVESKVKIKTSKLENFQNLEFDIPRGQPQVLFVEGLYPLDGVRFQDNASFTWSPTSHEKEVVFTNLTEGKAFVLNQNREFVGLSVVVTNTSDTYDVNVSQNIDSQTNVIGPNETRRITFDGSSYLFY